MTVRTWVSALVVAASLSAGSSLQAEDGWLKLFNGRDLSGWEHKGEGQFFVEEGQLIGTQTDGKGGNFYTLSEWSDFELRAVYKMDWPANSGFWYRFDPKTENGYQFDILKYTNPVAFSGTLYFPARMFIFANLDEATENRDDWNEAKIRAEGGKFTHWLNGKKIGEGEDAQLKSGRIGIQVHPGNDVKGMKITIKSLEIRPITAP
ncbi:MAG: DUF1080 domain-containing protein [Verrucomicrobiota bacterium]|jgi:hypothetical protein|nr:DUF1080 domain-containing protein [Verrucomicrobiota bacterium]